MAAIEQARAYLPAGSTSPLLDLVAACETQLAISLDDTGRAAILAKGCEAPDRRARLEAMMQLASGDAGSALLALEAVRSATLRQRLDVAVLRARALSALGRRDADEMLSRTVGLARREGFVVALVEDMPELRARVSFLLRSQPIGAFEQTVLDRLDRPRHSLSVPDSGVIVEQLTPREQTVLRYLSSRLTVTEIAAEVFVSVNTMKTHVKAVYRKLGVSSRRQAIAEGQRLLLL